MNNKFNIDPSEQNQILFSIKPDKIYILLKGLPLLILPIGLIVLLFLLKDYHFISKILLHIILHNKLFIGVIILLILRSLYKSAAIYSVTYHFTDNLLIIEKGIFNKHIDYYQLFRVKDFLIDQPLFLMLTNLMNFTIYTFDEKTKKDFITLYGIRKSELPETFRKLILNAKRLNNVHIITN